MTDTPRDRFSTRLIGVTVLGSLMLTAGLFAVYLFFHSQIALAQAADSLSDMLGGAILLWAARVSRRPADAEHPGGHARAESIGALTVALMAGVLAAEVLRSAIAALLGGAQPELDWPVAAVFAIKVIFKAGIAATAGRRLRRARHPVLAALKMDARNDMLVGLAALIGFGLARWGLSRLDASLAIVTAFYVGYAGVRLGRENASLLLGESAAPERMQQLAQAAREVPGVRGTSSVVAIWHGTQLHVQLTIEVDESLPLRQAHEIGHAVERRLLLGHDVGEASIHVSPDPASRPSG